MPARWNPNDITDNICYDMHPILAFDTNVIVTALRSRSGASHALLRALHKGRLSAVVSVPMMLEYEEVLMRREHREVTGMNTQDVQDFLDELSALLIPVTPWFLWRPRLQDPSDEMVLEAALNGGADAIVTFNVRDFLPGVAGFGLRVLRPDQTLGEIGGPDG